MSNQIRGAGLARSSHLQAKRFSKLPGWLAPSEVLRPGTSRAPGYGASIASRTFLDKSDGLNGFCRKNVPGFDMASRTALLLM